MSLDDAVFAIALAVFSTGLLVILEPEKRKSGVVMVGLVCAGIAYSLRRQLASAPVLETPLVNGLVVAGAVVAVVAALLFLVRPTMNVLPIALAIVTWS